MYKRKTTIQNPTGIHARPASDFITAATPFQSKLLIGRVGDDEDEYGNAKSIINILALGLLQGEEVEIIGKGTDEQEAVDALVALIDSRFGE